MPFDCLPAQAGSVCAGGAILRRLAQAEMNFIIVMPEGKGKGDAQTGASQRRLKKKFIKSYVPEGTWLCLRERGRLAQAEKLSGEGGRRAGWRQLAQVGAGRNEFHHGYA